MEFIALIEQNLLAPPILFFALGVLAGIIKSDLEVPESISRYLSLYLMMAIGFKGGVGVASISEITSETIYTALSGVIIGAFQPFLGYALLKWFTRVDTPTAAAIAAHYGSVSVVTFATAAAFLEANSIIYAGYIIAVLALMEVPAIISGLFIAHHEIPEVRNSSGGNRKIGKDILTNGSVLLLLGAFIIGSITGQSGMDKMSGFLHEPFQGILCFFLLDMGLLVARNLQHLKSFSWPLVAFGIYMPLIGAVIGMGFSMIIGIDVGTSLLFVTLCASASYIAVPAAMRVALPEARAAIYVPMSLAITFPFNIAIGIPVYFAALELLHGA